MKLLFNALIKLLCGFILICTLIFWPAGTLNFSGGWTFIGLLFVPVSIMGVVLFIKAPELLKKRLESKEKENTQKFVVVFSALVFLGGFIIAGFDFRFGWSNVPTAVYIAASVLFIVAYILYVEVMRENAYLSRTIKVQENQKVIDTGLYGIVRHPMYMATILLFLCVPLIIGSWYSFYVFLLYPIIIVLRIKNEEKILIEQLEGYTEYKQKVKYRIIPFLW